MTTTTNTNAARRPRKAAVDHAAASTRSTPTVVAGSDFSLEWLTDQRAALLSERQALTGQAQRLEDEASALLDDGETGDVKFDDEGAEGDGMAVERDRDLMLSAPGWAVHNHASYDDYVYELTVQDQALNIAMESLLWQESLKLPMAVLGVQEGVGTNRAAG